MQTPKAIELPKLPEMPDRVQLNRGIEQSGISIYGFTADQMNAHFLAGVEAGRAAASGQAGWVSVDDQLPTKYEDVWIVNFDDVQRAIWSDIDREFLVEDVHGAYERAFGVTHWMLSIIPAAPGASPSALVASPVEVQARRIESLKGALAEALEFVEDHEDVTDGPDGEPQANRAMQLAQTLRASLAASPAVAGEAGVQP